MSIWKDASGVLHDDMDGVALELPSWPGNRGIELVKLTKKQVDDARSATVSTSDSIKDQIRQLESQQTQRRIREAALGLDDGWLDDLNSQIEALRAQL